MRKVIEMGAAIADGLAAAHAKGIVHRALKPSSAARPIIAAFAA